MLGVKHLLMVYRHEWKDRGPNALCGGPRMCSLSYPCTHLPTVRIMVAMRNYLTILVCVGACLLWTVPASAAEPYTPVHPDPLEEKWRWRSYPELSGRGLKSMTEDRDGNLWFGVDDGVVRYDGIEWVDYTEEDGVYGSPVVTLCATRDGSVYAGTDLGVSRFREGQWERVLQGDMPWVVSRLSVGSDDDVWAATVWGAMRISNDKQILYGSAGISAAGARSSRATSSSTTRTCSWRASRAARDSSAESSRSTKRP